MQDRIDSQKGRGASGDLLNFLKEAGTKNPDFLKDLAEYDPSAARGLEGFLQTFLADAEAELRGVQQRPEHGLPSLDIQGIMHSMFGVHRQMIAALEQKPEQK